MSCHSRRIHWLCLTARQTFLILFISTRALYRFRAASLVKTYDQEVGLFRHLIRTSTIPNDAFWTTSNQNHTGISNNKWQEDNKWMSPPINVIIPIETKTGLTRTSLRRRKRVRRAERKTPSKPNSDYTLQKIPSTARYLPAQEWRRTKAFQVVLYGGFGQPHPSHSQAAKMKKRRGKGWKKRIEWNKMEEVLHILQNKFLENKM